MLRARVILGAASLVALLAKPAFSAFFPLELTNIKPIGAAPAGLDPGNRIYRAYPGIEYNIRAAVVGGDYPFSFTLTNAPEGMTINPTTGEIAWPSPRANATPTITVRDSAGAQVSATWPITVTTDGFVFVDAKNGRSSTSDGCSTTCGTGTITNPWRTIKDLYLQAPAGTFAYFRSGVYDVLDLPRVNKGGAWERVEFIDRDRPVVWMAYPGDAPEIDFGYQAGVESGPMIRFGGSNVYVDGFATKRSHIIAFQVGHHDARGSTFRRLTMRETGPGITGSNAAFIMFTQNYPIQAYGVTIQDSTFCGVTGQGTTVKTYSTIKLLIENTTHCSAHTGLELKSDTSQFTVRGNTFRDFVSARPMDAAIGGNMHMVKHRTYGEILFNNVVFPTGIALRVNQDGQAREIYVHRNTFVGRVQVDPTDADDGPFTFSNNLIVSDDSGPSGSRIYHASRTDASRTIESNNLGARPSAKMVDAAGNLTAANAKYIGTRGHMLGSR
jgi:hypothetical protein